jgi:hypothetical protein
MRCLIAISILAAATAVDAATPRPELSDYVYLHVTRNEGVQRVQSCRGTETTPVRL